VAIQRERSAGQRPSVQLPPGCSCRNLGNDQLALIGAAFVAGVGVGKGQLGQVGSTDVLPEDSPQKCIHQIPTIPLKLNGKSAARESIKDFDGKPLYFVLDEAGLAGDVLQVFSTPDKALEFFRRTSNKPKSKTNNALINIGTGSSAQDIANAIGGTVTLFEHTNFGGAQWTFTAGTAANDGHAYQSGDGNIGDFRRVLCFLWWCQNINDRVSSIQNNSEVWRELRPQRSFAVLHEHINFGGSQLLIPERSSIQDLVPFGWNDRGSSLSYGVV